MQAVGEDCHRQSYSVVDSAIIARQDVAKGTVVTSQLESIGPTRDAAATVLLSGVPSDFLPSNCSSYIQLSGI